MYTPSLVTSVLIRVLFSASLFTETSFFTGQTVNAFKHPSLCVFQWMQDYTLILLRKCLFSAALVGM